MNAKLLKIINKLAADKAAEATARAEAAALKAADPNPRSIAALLKRVEALEKMHGL